MGRQSGLSGGTGCLFLILLLGLLGYSFEKLGPGITATILILIVISIIVFNAYLQIKTDRLIEEKTADHKNNLLIKKRQLASKDAYGNVFYDKWFKEIDYFLDNVVFSGLSHTFPEKRQEHIKKVDSIVTSHSKSHVYQSSFYDGMSPLDYEIYCADVLNSVGWNARTTQGSGDQGIDVIAIKNGVKLVLQCKLYYSGSVGNKAVQEISAGRIHENAQKAAVVSNAQYTNSAQELANTTGVYLLHHDQLKFIDDLLGA